MDFRLTDKQIEHRKECYKVCAELEKKKPKSWVGFESQFDTEEGWDFHRYCAKEFAKRGWLALGWPKEYGGTGEMMDKVLFAEARGYYDLAGSDIFGVSMLAPTLLAAGSEEIKKEFLPKIANAELMFCELWSEPNSGSDLAGLQACARAMNLSSTARRHGIPALTLRTGHSASINPTPLPGNTTTLHLCYAI
jgi:alkylation response protein AidB-like acyl-CoA dehydrogenase